MIMIAAVMIIGYDCDCGGIDKRLAACCRFGSGLLDF